MTHAKAYEFGSSGWLAMVHAQFRERVEAALQRDPRQDLTFSLCEAFAEPPAHIGRDRVGWAVRMKAGGFEFFDRELDDVQYKVIAPYHDILPLIRFRIGRDAERAAHYASLGAALAKAGRVTVIGALPALPQEFSTLHDAVAERTL